MESRKEKLDRIERENEFEEWKKKYKSKTVPSRLSPDEKKKWRGDVYLYKNDKGIDTISGGGRILLFLCYIEGGWKKYLAKCKKKKWLNYYYECKKFRFREKLMGLKMIANLNPKNVYALLNDDKEVNNG